METREERFDRIVKQTNERYEKHNPTTIIYRLKLNLDTMEINCERYTARIEEHNRKFVYIIPKLNNRLVFSRNFDKVTRYRKSFVMYTYEFESYTIMKFFKKCYEELSKLSNSKTLDLEKTLDRMREYMGE